VVPPLRARKEEIPGLVDRFIRAFNEANETGVDTISPEAMDVLYRHDWPGNVRELKNTVERAMVTADGTTIRPVHLQLETMTAPAGSDVTPRARAAAVAPGAEAASNDDLNERQSRLVEILSTRRSITNRDYAEIMNVSDRTGLRDLRELMERGVIVRVGSRRAAEYRLA
jgi:DNA-binding NtrC family response regulator